MLDDPHLRSRLLRHAQRTLESYVTGHTLPIDDDWPADLLRCGVFVTLRVAGCLRGCIGTFEATDALPALIARMTLAAANDPRFANHPLSARELPDLRIELSLLSPLERIADPLDFELGRHGIYLRHGTHVGCFLPSVAIEHGWSKEILLAQCCAQKAGLVDDAWRDPDAAVFRFTVDKIVE
jgi:AmmeMemoRadiSam system protein A